jgi:hypothetical protein
MSGGIEETSASFEARSAPRSYPTWQIWFDWWLPPSGPAHEVVTVDFRRKRVIGRMAG